MIASVDIAESFWHSRVNKYGVANGTEKSFRYVEHDLHGTDVSDETITDAFDSGIGFGVLDEAGNVPACIKDGSLQVEAITFSQK